jgi:hypothetical protein
MLVRVAGESLAESDRESAGERCEQFALGLQKFAPHRELACESKIVFLSKLQKTLWKSHQVFQDF